MGNILQWVAGIVAAFKKPTENIVRPKSSAPDIAVETRAESVAATSHAPATLTTAAGGGSESGRHAHVASVTPIPPDQQEIKRRRELVRTLFNNFWSDRDDKPAAFVDRLNEAETYLNERLTACGEPWQLDGQSRKLLGLPSRSNSRQKVNGAAQSP